MSTSTTTGARRIRMLAAAGITGLIAVTVWKVRAVEEPAATKNGLTSRASPTESARPARASVSEDGVVRVRLPVPPPVAADEEPATTSTDTLPLSEPGSPQEAMEQVEAQLKASGPGTLELQRATETSIRSWLDGEKPSETWLVSSDCFSDGCIYRIGYANAAAYEEAGDRFLKHPDSWTGRVMRVHGHQDTDGVFKSAWVLLSN